jgi:hypothetical protein
MWHMKRDENNFPKLECVHKQVTQKNKDKNNWNIFHTKATDVMATTDQDHYNQLKLV